MSIFDHQRLTNATFKLDIERMRQGWYTDKDFVNIAKMLTVLAEQGYNYRGMTPRLPSGISPEVICAGDLEVEMQWFNRRAGMTLVVGVDKALTMLRHCCGYWQSEQFVDTFDHLEVWAVQDGCTVDYSGDPEEVRPVLRVSGRYRDFAMLETAHPGDFNSYQPRGYQRLRDHPGGTRQTRPVLPSALQPARSPGRRWLRLQHGCAALQRRLRQQAGSFHFNGCPGRLVGRLRRRHRGSLGDRLLPGGYQ